MWLTSERFKENLDKTVQLKGENVIFPMVAIRTNLSMLVSIRPIGNGWMHMKVSQKSFPSTLLLPSNLATKFHLHLTPNRTVGYVRWHVVLRDHPTLDLLSLQEVGQQEWPCTSWHTKVWLNLEAMDGVTEVLAVSGISDTAEGRILTVCTYCLYD